MVVMKAILLVASMVVHLVDVEAVRKELRSVVDLVA